MDKLGEDERVAQRQITVEQLIATAQRIFQPYTLDVKEVVWWSVYEIGQRICDKYDNVPAGREGQQLPRVFIAGDACHTHSPKAGQGMNFSMQDTFNLGWKLVSVLRGLCSPSMLHSYNAERQTVGQTLIDFDREWSKMISEKPVDGGQGGVDPKEFQRYFEQHQRFTAGMGTKYSPGLLCGDAAHQALAWGFEVGTRFHSAPVLRITDAKVMELGHVGKADGRWRLYAFAGMHDATNEQSGVRALCRFLESSPNSPVLRYTGPGQDPDAVFDLRAIFQQSHRDLAFETMPALLRPLKGRLGLRDYEKVFSAQPKHGPDIFELRGVNREQGVLVVVRPDQYIAQRGQGPCGQGHIVRVLYFALAQIDAHQPRATGLAQIAAEVPHRGHSRARAQLDHDHACLRPRELLQPGCQSLLLGLAAFRQPAAVTEHQDVGPRERVALWAARQRAGEAAGGFIDHGHERLGAPDDRLAALLCLGALQVVDGAVTFVERAAGKACALELPVHIAGEHTHAQTHARAPAAQDLEAGVGHGASVELEAVAIEAPGQGRVAREGARAGHGGEFQPGLCECGVGAPETGVAAKVRQARVHAHAGASRDDQGIGFGDEVGSRVAGGAQFGGAELVHERHGGVGAGAHVLAVVEHRHVGQAHSTPEQVQGTRVAREDALRWHGMAAFLHALAHARQQLLRLVERDHEQHDEKARRLGLGNKLQLGRMGEHGFADEALPVPQQLGAPCVGPLLGRA
ncbi:unnamed protein product [Victoria cruziana]